jgi:hypothetical protein
MTQNDVDILFYIGINYLYFLARKTGVQKPTDKKNHPIKMTDFERNLRFLAT